MGALRSPALNKPESGGTRGSSSDLIMALKALNYLKVLVPFVFPPAFYLHDTQDPSI